MNTPNTKKNLELDEDIVSKSELKRQMHERQKLGESLIDLPEKKLRSLPIGEELLEAIEAVREMKNDNGRRRQLQRIGKLMRHEDIDAIKNELNHSLKQEKQQHAVKNQQIEQAKTIYHSLINDGNQALTDFIDQYPQANRQLLRQLISNICKENKKPASENKPSKNASRLMDELRTLIVQ